MWLPITAGLVLATLWSCSDSGMDNVNPNAADRDAADNPPTHDDLDGDGIVEMAWVQTPHIGRVLRVTRTSRGHLSVLSESTLYSNHAVGDRNLCLSVVVEADGERTLYLPSFDRSQIVGLRLIDSSLFRTQIIDRPVDFSASLSSQHSFTGLVQVGGDCAIP